MDLSLNEYILILLLMGAVYFDLTRRRIPNYLTIPAMVWGLLSYAVDSGWTGLWESLLGLLAGIGIFVIPFLLGGMGGGDVKLMGAIGALTGL
ncbi:MAG TPA: prepilin peptidase, partial [Bacillota bacterium]|nr:prepilin peptidase [Bacillota bacterium]